MVRSLLRAAKKTKKAVKKAKKGTQKLFADRFVSQLDEGQAPSRGTLDVEAGKAGKVTRGKKSSPRMEEAASKGSRKRAKVKVEAERKAREGDAKAAAKVKRMDKQSAKAEASRARKAAASKSESARKDKGVSLAGMEGKMTVGSKPKLKDSDMMVGNTTNGVTKDGEVIGNPTDNQIAAVVRNFEARERLSTDAKRNLAKLKRMSKREKQDRAINRLNKNLRDTGPDRKSRGGFVRSGHTDMRKGGLFYR